MKTLKVTGLTKNEVELRNHIYDYISYEDEMTTEDGGVFWDFSYGIDMEPGTMESWAKELGWKNDFCKGVFGSLMNKGVFYEMCDKDSRYGQPYACINSNAAECFAEDNKNGWFDYDVNGNYYTWELAK